MMQCCLNKNKDCSNLIITCLETLLNSINFNSLLGMIIQYNFYNNLCKVCLSHGIYVCYINS